MASLSIIGWLACAVLIINLSTLAEAATCAPGTYVSGNTCKKCAPGTYTNRYNQLSCTQARAGYYVAISGATSESSCRQGTFNSVQGATGCCSCCAGWFNNKAASTSCQKCPSSSPYSSPGATWCIPFQGLYAPLPSCFMDGRNCPVTFIDEPSGILFRRSEPGIPTCATTRERACPVYRTRNGIRTQIGHKCQVVANDLWSCGGCPNEDREEYAGEDCTEIPNADSVQCHKGKCVVRSCVDGHTSSENHASCVPDDPYGGLIALSLQSSKGWNL